VREAVRVRARIWCAVSSSSPCTGSRVGSWSRNVASDNIVHVGPTFAPIGWHRSRCGAATFAVLGVGEAPISADDEQLEPARAHSPPRKAIASSIPRSSLWALHEGEHVACPNGTRARTGPPVALVRHKPHIATVPAPAFSMPRKAVHSGRSACQLVTARYAFRGEWSPGESALNARHAVRNLSHQKLPLR
jgi:hypothetical protein